VSQPLVRSARHTRNLRRRLPSVPRLRALQCLYWVQEGKSSTEIGLILGISGRTVENHIAAACQIFGVHTRLQAVIRARERGLIGASEPMALSSPPRSFRPT
jgi:DNA-binding CsgD family transcriptional regulator